jgi:hypothetical protein
MLFVITPLVAFKSSAQIEILQEGWKRVVFSPFSNLALMFLSLLPLICIAGLMSIAAIVTGKSYIAAENPFAIGMQWFFIMLPFSALLAPAVIFFFNFSAEVHALLFKKMHSSSAV